MSIDNTRTAPELSQFRKYAAFLVICVVELLVVLDNTVVNVALPDIGIDMSAGFSGLQWVVDAYILTFCGLLLAFGNLTDRYGRKRFLLIGLTGLGAMSIVGAVADTLGQLIASRALMGIASAAVLPATLAVIMHIFRDPKERAMAIGVWSSVAGVAIAIGPVTGGFLIEHFSWHSVFWLNVPIAIIGIVAVIAFVPESKSSDVGPLDYPGVALSVTGVTLLVFSIIEAPHVGWLTLRTVLGIVVAIAILAGFVLRQKSLVYPLLDVRLFLIKPFAMPALAIAVAYFALFGYVFLVTQYFQGVRNYTALEFGLASIPFAVGLAISAPIATVVAQKVGTMPVLVTGLVAVAIGMVMAGQADVDSSYLTLLLPTMLVLAFGVAIIQGPATESIMSSLPLEEAGSGSAVNDTTRELGGTLGVAVLGSVVASYYTAKVNPIVASIPAGVMTDEERAYANGSILSVREILARPIPEMFEPMRDSLIFEMKSAAMHGSETASYVAAGAVLVTAVIVGLVLPRSHRTSGIMPNERATARVIKRARHARPAGREVRELRRAEKHRLKTQQQQPQSQRPQQQPTHRHRPEYPR